MNNKKNGNMLTALPDDELLNVPLANLMPGELKRAFFIQAQQAEKKQIAERELLTDIMAARNGEKAEKATEETHRREAALLAAVQAHEEQIAEAARELDKRTLRLDDGRRVYVDGDKYRDEKGGELHDADRAQAELHHLEQPHAATWQEKRALDESFAETRQMRQQIEDLQAGKAGANETALLSRYEKQMQTAGALPAPPGLPDYSDTDYMGALTAKPFAKNRPAL